jgi:hypothetical protein
MNKFHLLLIFLLLYSFAHVAISQEPNREPDKRMAGYHHTVVFTGEKIPSSAVMTYRLKTLDNLNFNFLVKFKPCFSIDGKIIYPSAFRNIEVNDTPGGVEASFTYENTKIITRITPLMMGRGAKTWTGAALYEVQTFPAREVLIFFDKGLTHTEFIASWSPFTLKDSATAIINYRRIDDKSIGFYSGIDSLNMVVIGSEPVSVGKISNKEKQTYVRMSGGSGFILTAFSDHEDDMKGLEKINIAEEKALVKKYYDELFKTSLKTPEPKMNEAFTSALYNLEYSWFEPFGWGECLHHWPALWHMQVGAAADLIGQTDRSKSCILEHATHLFKSGAVPQFMPNKLTKRDFGGSNQFWVWQVRHYLNYTGDKEFAKQILPYVDTVINQTLEEYDKDGDLLLAWGTQIGNQEDMLANPYNGAVPSIELYNMFMTRAELSKYTGDSVSASLWMNKASIVQRKLYKELWMNDLGRFAYYKDPTGHVMLDGQYQTYLYPIIYDVVDKYDKYTGLRHLRDRLTGENGAVYASNNFPYHHPTATWGMAANVAQQPWASLGLSKSGLYNEAWRPLKVMADWAQDINRRGSWPECGPESTPAYFTPPAGLYIVAITEALFGINVHAPEGYLEISPSFPDLWPYANLNLPDFKVNYSRNLNHLEYNLSTSKDLNVKVRWRLPVSRIKRCTVNNKDVPFTIVPDVNHIILSFDVPHSSNISLNIEFEPVNLHINAPHSVAVGDNLDISVTGAKIEQVVDRSGVLESIRLTSPSSFSSKIQARLLDPYISFNQLGLLNFSRRTFFMDCLTKDGIPFIASVDLNILPRFEAASVGNSTGKIDDDTLQVKVRNNTSKTFAGKAGIIIANTHLLIPVNLPSRSDQVVNIPLASFPQLCAGDNIASLSIPGETEVDVHFTSKARIKTPQFLPVELPVKDLIPDTLWSSIRIMPGFPHIFFAFTNYGMPKPMWALKNVTEIEAKQIPGLKFKIPDQKFIPVSHLAGKVSYKFDLPEKKYKKLYILVLPFVDNHNTFSTVARITAYNKTDIVYSRTLSYPGDVDYWVPDKNPESFATFKEPRPDRFELLPLLNPDATDWKEGKPPVFPQPKWWSTSLPVVTESCVMSIIEINLSKPVELNSFVFEVLGVMPAFGIVGVTGELDSK